MKKIMTGNEAVARGAYEAGVRYASAYPGTPSTEILQNLSQYKEIVSEWAPNEKVALEAVIGASIAGGRTFAAMKHVGVNVAADPLFTFALTKYSLELSMNLENVSELSGNNFSGELSFVVYSLSWKKFSSHVW